MHGIGNSRVTMATRKIYCMCVCVCVRACVRVCERGCKPNCIIIHEKENTANVTRIIYHIYGSLRTAHCVTCMIIIHTFV